MAVIAAAGKLFSEGKKMMLAKSQTEEWNAWTNSINNSINIHWQRNEFQLNAGEEGISLLERNFLLGALTERQRLDGRRDTDFRQVRLVSCGV